MLGILTAAKSQYMLWRSSSWSSYCCLAVGASIWWLQWGFGGIGFRSSWFCLDVGAVYPVIGLRIWWCLAVGAVYLLDAYWWRWPRMVWESFKYMCSWKFDIYTHTDKPREREGESESLHPIRWLYYLWEKVVTIFENCLRWLGRWCFSC